MKAIDVIRKHKPCKPFITWLGNKTVEQMVNDCDRGDWLHWVAERSGVGFRKLKFAEGLAAKTFIHLMKDKRSVNAVNAAIKFGNGEIDLNELNEAYKAAEAAHRDAENPELNDVRIASDLAAVAYEPSHIKAGKNSAKVFREVFGEDLINKLIQSI